MKRMTRGIWWLPIAIAVGCALTGCTPQSAGTTTASASNGSPKEQSGASQIGPKKPDINEQMMEKHPEFKAAVQDQIIAQIQKSNFSDTEKQSKIAEIRSGKLPR